MNLTLRLLPVNMVYETGKSVIASTHLSAFSFRAANYLTAKLNGMEHRTYEDAITALNGLQTNLSVLKESIGRAHNNECPHVRETERYLHKVGITLDDLDRLSVIHVAGTKGKGSTCALVESILRNLNVKTGFYSSPHLLNVTERIRLNGEPISKAKFTQYFWKVYNELEQSKQNADDMPPYFKFLTIMAYYIFLNEKVDVAVVEVGIGGEHDCTNVLRNTQTVGITSLGLEHTQLLGNTYRDIAWQKSGIIKTGSSVFSAQQHNECIPVLVNRSQEKDATIHFVPDFSEYKYHDEKVLAEIAINPTKLRNSSLALQLSYDWIRKNHHKIENKLLYEHLKSLDGGITLKKEIAEGLVNCYWPGRCQILQYRNLTIYIDGAHTIDSLSLCIDWFTAATNSSSGRKILIFNVTGERNANNMLNLIYQNKQFDEAIFTPNISSVTTHATDNMYAFAQPNRSQENLKYWKSLSPENKAQAFNCISDVFNYLQTEYKTEQISVLVTGSLHLIGEVLRTIEIEKE